MQKTRNPDCLYIKSLDILRPFLSLISYGCYSRMQIKNRLPYASAYDRLNYSNSVYPQPVGNVLLKRKNIDFSFTIMRIIPWLTLPILFFP